MNMPITVMLVDDEPLALENVYEMVPWSAHGFEVVAKAANGRMALQLFERLQPQIVITDISMSPMDGLELGRLISALEPKTQLIFLTAYRDFEYARQALEMRAASYLLKHEISRNRLLDHLLQMKQGLEAEAHEKDHATRRLLRDMLTGQYQQPARGQEPLLYRQLFERIQGQTALLYFEFDPLLQRNGSRQARRLTEAVPWPSIEQEIQEALEEVDDIFVLEMEASGYAVYVKLSAPNSTLLLQYTLQKVSLALQQGMQAHSNEVPKIMMATSTDKEHLQRLYGMMRQAYDYSLFLPPRAVFLLDQVSAAENCSATFAGEQLLLQLQSGPVELTDLKNALNEIVKSSNLRALRLAIRHADARWFKDEAYRPDLPLGADIRQIVSALYRLFEEEAKDELQRTSYSRWVKKAMAYVRQHYSNPELSLETVADHIQISVVHLRTTFKKETGQSLLDYTTALRVEAAKRLLQNGELKVYEVAEQVGYKTSQYFSQVFKKWTGVQPKDYVQQEEGY